MQPPRPPRRVAVIVGRSRRAPSRAMSCCQSRTLALSALLAGALLLLGLQYFDSVTIADRRYAIAGRLGWRNESSLFDGNFTGHILRLPHTFKSGVGNVLRQLQGSMGRQFKPQPTATVHVAPANLTKLVIDWTGFFGDRTHLERIWKGCRKSCEQKNCNFSKNRDLAGKADAIVFHMRDVNLGSLPKTRSPNQAYVFYLFESPAHAGNTKGIKPNFFNWTTTYRRDSDFFAPYFDFGLREREQNLTDIEPILANKSKMVAWFVSNCHTPSRREVYVNALKAHITVDVFGSCGKKKCPRSNQAACDAMLKSNYRFYLAFENTVCKDYVTEKFARSNHLVVPIVLRSAEYAHFPEKSYIAADQFKSPKDLADHLKMLSENQTAYLEYFQWRRRFKFASIGCKPYCQLCERLHDTAFLPKSYPSIHSWWNNASCEGGFAQKLARRT